MKPVAQTAFIHPPASYSVYNLAFLFDDDVQEEYRRRHNGHPNIVQLNDAGFAVHVRVYTPLPKHLSTI